MNIAGMRRGLKTQKTLKARNLMQSPKDCYKTAQKIFGTGRGGSCMLEIPESEFGAFWATILMDRGEASKVIADILTFLFQYDEKPQKVAQKLSSAGIDPDYFLSCVLNTLEFIKIFVPFQSDKKELVAALEKLGERDEGGRHFSESRIRAAYTSLRKRLGVGSSKEITSLIVDISSLVEGDLTQMMAVMHGMPGASELPTSNVDDVENVHREFPFAFPCLLRKLREGGQNAREAAEEVKKLLFHMSEQLLMVSPQMVQLQILALLKVLREILLENPTDNLDWLNKATQVVSKFFKWPRPYCDVAQECLNMMAAEMRAPGHTMREQLIREYPMLHPEYEAEDHMAFEELGPPGDAVVRVLTNGRNEHCIFLSVILSEADRKQSRESLRKSVQTLKIQILMHMISCDLDLNDEDPDDPLGLEFATPEMIDGYYQRALDIHETCLELPIEEPSDEPDASTPANNAAVPRSGASKSLPGGPCKVYRESMMKALLDDINPRNKATLRRATVQDQQYALYTSYGAGDRPISRASCAQRYSLSLGESTRPSVMMGSIAPGNLSLAPVNEAVPADQSSPALPPRPGAEAVPGPPEQEVSDCGGFDVEVPQFPPMQIEVKHLGSYSARRNSKVPASGGASVGLYVGDFEEDAQHLLKLVQNVVERSAPLTGPLKPMVVEEEDDMDFGEYPEDMLLTRGSTLDATLDGDALLGDDDMDPEVEEGRESHLTVTVPPSQRPKMRIVIMGGNIVWHRFVCSVVNLTEKYGNWMDEVDLLVYTLPPGHNEIAKYLACQDLWYRRHIYAPFLEGPPNLAPQYSIDDEMHERCLDGQFTYIVDRMKQSDNIGIGGILNSLPVQVLRENFQNYMRTARCRTPIAINECLCWKADETSRSSDVASESFFNSRQSIIIPFLCSVEIGLLAEVERFRQDKMQNSRSRVDSEADAAPVSSSVRDNDFAAGYKTSVLVHIEAPSIGSSKTPRANEEEASYLPDTVCFSTITITNTMLRCGPSEVQPDEPDPNDDRATPLESWLVLQTRPCAGPLLEYKALRTGLRDRQAETLIGALKDRSLMSERKHASRVNVSVAEGGDPFYILVDGSVRGPFTKVSLQPLAHVPPINVMSFFPVQESL